MQLAELINRLEREQPDNVIALGFTNPHSYRGSYYELAFEPAQRARVGDMLADAKRALGSTYTGYKGGDFTMGETTYCNLATYGDCGEELGPLMLNLMLQNVVGKRTEAEPCIRLVCVPVHLFFHLPAGVDANDWGAACRDSLLQKSLDAVTTTQLLDYAPCDDSEVLTIKKAPYGRGDYNLAEERKYC